MMQKKGKDHFVTQSKHSQTFPEASPWPLLHTTDPREAGVTSLLPIPPQTPAVSLHPVVGKTAPAARAAAYGCSGKGLIPLPSCLPHAAQGFVHPKQSLFQQLAAPSPPSTTKCCSLAQESPRGGGLCLSL